MSGWGRVMGRAVLVVALTASVAAPAAAQEEPSLSVLPSEDLVDAQLVALDTDVVVPGEILPVGVELSTCLDEWAAGTERPCNLVTVSELFTSSLSSGRVARFVEAEGQMVDCAVESCSVVYTKTSCVPIGPIGTCANTDSASVEAPVEFRPGRGVGTSGFWDDGATVRVAATGLITDPVAVAAAIQCAFLQGGGIACGPTGTVETNFDGEYDGSIVVREQFEQNGIAVDCTVDLCLVSVIVLGTAYRTIDGIGTYRQWGPPAWVP